MPIKDGYVDVETNGAVGTAKRVDMHRHDTKASNNSNGCQLQIALGFYEMLRRNEFAPQALKLGPVLDGLVHQSRQLIARSSRKRFLRELEHLPFLIAQSSRQIGK